MERRGPRGHAPFRELAGHLQQACEAERKRIARDLHDEFGLALMALKLEACALTDVLREQAPSCAARAAAMEAQIDAAVGAMRRVIADLRPSLLDTLGLAAAIEWQAERFTEQTGIVCDLALDEGAARKDQAREDEALETALFRVAQELLTNVARHAWARRVRVTLRKRGGATILRVADDGRGFRKGACKGHDVEGASFGLLGLRERIRPWRGVLTIKSRTGCGTAVTVRIPASDR